jgi:hypothetical protein
MSSQERIEANRANSRSSTGPRTADGKARASRNALKHGLLSREVVLETEDRCEFEAFWEGMVADLRPQGDLEATLADRIAAQWWRLRRVGRMEACLIERDEEHAAYMAQNRSIAAPAPAGAGRPADAAVPPAAMGEALAETLGAKHCPYENLRRYERTIERGLESAMRQFREAQKLRAERKDPEEGQPVWEKAQEYLYWYLMREWEKTGEELALVRAAAEAAGVKLPSSESLREMAKRKQDHDYGAVLRWGAAEVRKEEAREQSNQRGADENGTGVADAGRHASASLREEACGAATRPNMLPANDAGSMAPANDAGSMAPANDAGSMAPAKDAGSMAPANDAGSMAPANDAGSMAPAVGFVSQEARQAASPAAERPVQRDITGRRIEPAGPAEGAKGEEAK